jgi:hypothetical protein
VALATQGDRQTGIVCLPQALILEQRAKGVAGWRPDGKWTHSRLDGQAATDFEPDVGRFPEEAPASLELGVNRCHVFMH